MKKYIKYFLLLSIATFYKCDNAIDIEQVGRLTPEVTFETVGDLQDGLIGAYTEYDLVREIAMAANYTDEVAEGVATGGQGRTTGHVFNLNAGSAAASTFWLNGYDELNAVNRLIEASEFVVPKDAAETVQKNDILGQAYALRAYSHFQLLCYYSTDYTDDNALAVIKMDYVPSITDQSLRSTNGEVFQLIEEDLDKAMSLLQTESERLFLNLLPENQSTD